MIVARGEVDRDMWLWRNADYLLLFVVVCLHSPVKYLGVSQGRLPNNTITSKCQVIEITS